MTVTIPEELAPLLDAPIYAALGTVRSDGAIQVNPMWFEYDGEFVKFTHLPGRVKYRNVQANPAMTVMLLDPDDPMRYLELRGRFVRSEPDPTGAFYVRLQNRYGNPSQTPPPDFADRIVLYMALDKASAH